MSIGNTKKIPYSSKASLCVELYVNTIGVAIASDDDDNVSSNIPQQMRPSWNA